MKNRSGKVFIPTTAETDFYTPTRHTIGLVNFAHHYQHFLEVVTVKKKDYGTGIPQHEIEALAACLLPTIQKFYETDEGKRIFEEWKKKQTSENSNSSK